MSDTHSTQPCSVDDHQWELHIEGGSVSLRCVDPCDIDPEAYDRSQAKLPACWWVPDSIDGVHGSVPARLTFERGSRDRETGARDDWSIEMSPATPQSLTRQAVYVLRDNQSGTYEVMADRETLEAFFAKYDRTNYSLSREPVVTLEALRREEEFFTAITALNGANSELTKGEELRAAPPLAQHTLPVALVFACVDCGADSDTKCTDCLGPWCEKCRDAYRGRYGQMPCHTCRNTEDRP